MRRIMVSILILCCTSLLAQVERTVITEHFTNTRCSVCASRNPGFYQNLSSRKKVLHLAVHPSSPYSTCALNRHNTYENDERTKYYAVYGSTPRILVQGQLVQPISDYNDPFIFTAHEGETSSLSVAVFIDKLPDDSLEVKVVVKTVGEHQPEQLGIFTAIAEEEVVYNAPNGEQLHHDVFRKSVFEVHGKPFLPAPLGDSLLFQGKVAIHPDWNLQSVYAVAIINKTSDKHVEQAGRSALLSASTGVLNPDMIDAVVYPNPVSGMLTIKVNNNLWNQVMLLSPSGIVIKEYTLQSSGTISTKGIPAGIYYLRIGNSSQQLVKKLVIND